MTDIILDKFKGMTNKVIPLNLYTATALIHWSAVLLSLLAVHYSEAIFKLFCRSAEQIP